MSIFKLNINNFKNQYKILLNSIKQLYKEGKMNKEKKIFK